MDHQDVRIVSSVISYQGHFAMRKIHLQHRLYQGEWSSVFEREIFARGDSVGVLLLDPATEQVVLIEQFRIGALRDKKTPWLLEIVAGVVETGEQIADVAVREVREEAGIEITDMVPMCEYWVSPGGSSEYLTLFCAKVDARQAGGVYGLASEHEDILVKVLTIDEALQALNQGLINNASTLIALQWLQLHRSSILERWQQ